MTRPVVTAPSAGIRRRASVTRAERIFTTWTGVALVKRLRRARRRLRCIRKGHRWVRRMDEAGGSYAVCLRCGRVRRGPGGA